MEKQYYTPNPNELFIGYELESMYLNEDNSYSKEVLDKESLYHTIDEIEQKIGLVSYRTPYLTKEDIESEGWKYDYTDPNGYICFLKEIQGLKENESGFNDKEGNFYAYNKNSLAYLPSKKELIITIQPNSCFSFLGECKSINELRKLQRWLGIK